jgi:hypothetical protein
MSILKALALVLIPLILILAGGKAMSWLSGRPMARGASGAEKPLNQRLGGYTVAETAAHWQPFSAERQRQERAFLEIDLVYPFLYGGALLAALLLARAWLGRPFDAVWVFLPVLLAVVGDWVENLIHLNQFGHWTRAGTSASAATLHSGWIQIASLATMVKLWSLIVVIGAVLVLAVLVACGVGRAGTSALN